MLSHVLQTLADHLNNALQEALNTSGVPRAAVGTPDPAQANTGDVRAVLTLISIGREAVQPPTPGPRVGNEAPLAEVSPLKLNLDVLLSITGGADYQPKLDLLELAMRVLHYDSRLSVGTAGDPMRPPGRIFIDLVGVSTQDQGSLWTMLQSPMLPSALYRVRGALITQQTTTMRGIVTQTEARAIPNMNFVRDRLVELVVEDPTKSPNALNDALYAEDGFLFGPEDKSEEIARQIKDVLAGAGYVWEENGGGAKVWTRSGTP